MVLLKNLTVEETFDIIALIWLSFCLVFFYLDFLNQNLIQYNCQ